MPHHAKDDQILPTYLFLYNISLWFGYFVLYPLIVLGVFYDEPLYDLTYSAYGLLILYSIMETLHAHFKITPSSTMFPLIQTCFKLLIFYGFIVNGPEANKSALYTRLLLLTWTTGELIRYPFYAFRSLKIENIFLTWMRYTVWILLYPIGIVCEWLIIYFSLDFLEERNPYTVFMPNEFNFSFNTTVIAYAYLTVGVWIGAYVMLTHMYRQRRRAIEILFHPPPVVLPSRPNKLNRPFRKSRR